MVNTFLTSGPDAVDETTENRGFRISAANLDNSRLWKQVLEALQILNIIENFHLLGKLFENPCPNNPYLVKEWTQKILKQYKALDYFLFLHQGKYIWYSKKSSKPIKLKYYEKYTILENGNIKYKNEVYHKYKVVLPGDNFITMGFASHPVVIMWMHHIDSLKYYINCHIEEFLSRGGKPETEKLLCKIDKPFSNIKHPVWTYDPRFHMNHRAALLTKEIERGEKAWYIEKKEFKKSYEYYINNPPAIKTKTTSSFEYYIWVFTQDVKNPRYKFNEHGECLTVF